ncbi:MAG: 30S ribosomal protein S16 [Chitinophagales bacterium]
MAVKLRLQRHGRGKRPFYHIVAADSRSRRDGKFIERLGDYNPLTSPATIHLDVDKAVDWIMKGAEPTDTVNAILKYKGVLFRKHLLRGVAKGVLTQEQADAKYNEWLEAHKNSVIDHKKKVHASKEDRLAKLLAEETKKKEDREAKRAAALQAAAAPAETTETAEAPAETTENTEAPAAE